MQWNYNRFFHSDGNCELEKRTLKYFVRKGIIFCSAAFSISAITPSDVDGVIAEIQLYHF